MRVYIYRPIGQLLVVDKIRDDLEEARSTLDAVGRLEQEE